MSDYRVSVIICAYTDKRWNELLQAVASLRAQTRLPDEILVVIDHNPVLAGRARAYFGDLRVGDSLRVLENVEQRGLSGARNTGIAQAKGDIFAFMDEDAAAEPDWLERLLEAYQDPSVIGVGGAILPAWQSGRPGWFPEEFDWVVGCTYRGLPVTRQPVRNLIGCNMSFRSAVFTTCGNFTEGIGRVGVRPLGCEETELSIRARQQYPTSELLYEPRARVHHQVPQSRANLGYFLSRCYSEGLSKASISRYVGTGSSLSSEWSYTLKTLPLGILRGLGSGKLGRSAAIALGLVVTTAGFVVGKLTGKQEAPQARPRAAGPLRPVANPLPAFAAVPVTGGNPEVQERGAEVFVLGDVPQPAPVEDPSGFRPARIVEIELSEPLKPVSPVHPRTGAVYTRALALVRLHGSPLGVLELGLPKDGLLPDQAAVQIWGGLEEAINAHLREDGLAHASALDPLGLPQTGICRPHYNADAPLASIVIATHNRVDGLAAVLETALAQDYPNYEIIVVDNAPTDDRTAAFMERAYGADPRVRCVSEDFPGLAVAHNRGLLEVRGAIVAFTDDDVLLDREWLSRIVSEFQADERVGCVTGMILPVEMETSAQGWIEQFGGFGKGLARRRFDLDQNRPDDVLFPYTAGKFGSGANMAFRASVLRDMGGFDPALGAGSLALGGDDLASFYEVIVRGSRLVYQPAAILYHSHRREYDGLRRQAYGYGAGLSAFLTRAVIERPTRLFDLAARAPRGLYYLLSSKSPKNQKKDNGYPEELTKQELKGFLYGPLAYIRSRWHVRSLKRGRLSPAVLRAGEPTVWPSSVKR